MIVVTKYEYELERVFLLHNIKLILGNRFIFVIQSVMFLI